MFATLHHGHNECETPKTPIAALHLLGDGEPRRAEALGHAPADELADPQQELAEGGVGQLVHLVVAVVGDVHQAEERDRLALAAGGRREHATKRRKGG